MTLEDDKARLLEGLRQEIRDERVLDAMRRVQREVFVPPGSRHLAYADAPLPIGEGQTISQPLIVALMTEALALRGTEKVLEVGTGSGYQTALLAELARTVVSTERVPLLADTARHLLLALGYHNVEVHLAGLVLGWPEGAPYDAILVTAGAPRVPPVLVDQLTPGGRLVIPVGGRPEQELMLIERLPGREGEGGRGKGEGEPHAGRERPPRTRETRLGPCRFVPLIGEEAWHQD
ncbi:MAG: protein-L-isoaspartate(D-aspartate) O-methyltransferase [Chloroflexi bacterium]|nr:protein-L-isoaspartate(D-aspartate) O-methyltransferase [Chloroflexota bacterium]